MVNTSSYTGTKTQAAHKGCACEGNYCPECGLPACRPHRPLKFADGALQSTYNAHYPGKKGGRSAYPALQAKDKMYVPPPGQFDPTTSHQTDYPPKHGAKPPRAGPVLTPAPYRPFDGSSTYNAFHNKKPMPPKDTKKPHPNLPSGQFYDLTSNKADYFPKPIPEKSRRKHDPLGPSLPFVGNSLYRDDFGPKKLPEKNPYKPPQLLPSKNDPNYTTYAKDFVPKPFAPQPPPCCDVPSHTHKFTHSHGISGDSQTKFVGTNTGKAFTLRG